MAGDRFYEKGQVLLEGSGLETGVGIWRLGSKGVGVTGCVGSG